MTLETIYYIGQTVAVVVIIATLIALLVQTRQTNALARIETSRSNLITFVTEQQRLYSTPDDAAFMHKVLYTSERLTEPEKLRFGFTMALIFGLLEVGVITNQSGLFRDTDQARAIDTVNLAYIASPRVRKWWKSSRVFYAKNPAFVALIDRLVAEAEAAAKKSDAP